MNWKIDMEVNIKKTNTLKNINVAQALLCLFLITSIA